jgi:hypothetical protein
MNLEILRFTPFPKKSSSIRFIWASSVSYFSKSITTKTLCAKEFSGIYATAGNKSVRTTTEEIFGFGSTDTLFCAVFTVFRIVFISLWGASSQ